MSKAMESNLALDDSPGQEGGTGPGFSLIDLLCGVTLLVISILAAVQSQLSSFDLTRSSRERSTAAADLESAMESALGLPAADIPIAGSEFEAEQEIARFTDLHLDNEMIVPTYPGYTPGGPIPNPLIIVMTLTWDDEKGRAHAIRATTAKLQ